MLPIPCAAAQGQLGRLLPQKIVGLVAVGKACLAAAGVPELAWIGGGQGGRQIHNRTKHYYDYNKSLRPMEIFFGTQWAPLSEFAGDFCGVVLGFKLAIGLIVKMGILRISLFDWDRVPLNLSVVWIPSVNSCLQTPAGSTSVIVVTHDEKIMPRLRRIYEVRDGVVTDGTGSEQAKMEQWVVQ